MEAETAERRLAAILSADVVGYSRLMAEDEAATLRTLTAYREEIGLLVRQHRGRVVDAPGDNLLAEFPTALDAVQSAVEIQRVIQARNADLPGDRRMEFRIGVHMGDVSVEDDKLYGDGVNIAARLEGLAKPGAVCISGTVYEQVEKKLNVDLEDLGEQKLKNITRPVQVYGVKLLLPGADGDLAEAALPGMDELTVPGFGGRPAIAVLPFDNLSGDPEQEYFADGLAEDLITRLSAWRGFPVIARNSSFVYKGQAVDVKRVSRELGVRYVVEGSVRKAGGRVRITAQLIDATTGHHLWAERYDRELGDIFSVQDEITAAIAASMHPELQRFDQDRVVRQQEGNLDAWELQQRGWWYYGRVSARSSKSDNELARSCFEKALEVDPRLGSALSGLALTHDADLRTHWAESTEHSLEELTRAAEESISIDDSDAVAHWALGRAYDMKGEPEKAVAAFERAIELNPSLATVYASLGYVLAIVGRPEEGIERVREGMRLSPRDPQIEKFLQGMTVAHFAAGRYEDAVEWAERAVQIRPDFVFAHRVLLASYAHLDRIEEAREELAQVMRREPQFSLKTLKDRLSGANPDFVERYVEGFHKAGLKE